MDYRERISLKLPSCRPIVDGNIVDGDFHELNNLNLSTYLYCAEPKKLKFLDDDFTRKVITRFQGVIEFVRDNEAYVLPEVVQEVGALSGQLSSCAWNYRGRFVQGRGKWRGLNGDHRNGLINLDRIAARCNQVWQEMISVQSPVDWHARLSQALLNSACNRSEDIVSETIAKHKGYIPFGVKLKTDQKLATLCYLAAFNEDVVLVTKDRGVIEITSRLREYFGNAEHRGDNTCPRHQIWTYDLNNGEIRKIPSFEMKKENIPSV